MAPGGARQGPHDLDAMGHVCSASPGSTADGMEAPRAHSNGPAVGDGAPCIPGASRSPAEGIVLTGTALCSDQLMATCPIHTWARVGAARAERAGGRSGARGGAGERARRSASAAGCLDRVEKVVPRWDPTGTRQGPDRDPTGTRQGPDRDPTGIRHGNPTGFKTAAPVATNSPLTCYFPWLGQLVGTFLAGGWPNGRAPGALTHSRSVDR
jgi:hypothetical protein